MERRCILFYRSLPKCLLRAYLLGETDLNTQSIWVKNRDLVCKIDHDRSLKFEHFPLVPGSTISVFSMPDIDNITSWCGFSPDTPGEVPSLKAQLQKCDDSKRCEIDAAAKAVFIKMASLDDTKIESMVSNVGFTELDQVLWIERLRQRRDACQKFITEPSSVVVGAASELLAAASPGLSSSPRTPTSPSVTVFLSSGGVDKGAAAETTGSP